MKKNDFILIIAILLVAGAVFLGYHNFQQQGPGFVKVTVDGELYGTYSLEENREIEINDTNHLLIQDGQADVTWADCPDKICVNQRAISASKESIICLPNQVIVEIVGGEDAKLDAVAN